MATVLKEREFCDETGAPMSGVVIGCDCGRVVECELGVMTNECECGSAYNSFGQALRPRDEWEETESDY